MKLTVLFVTLGIILTGCLNTVGSAAAICKITLPTVSVHDTPQTIIGVTNFSQKFKAGCGN